MAALGRGHGLDSARGDRHGRRMLLYEDAGGYVLVGVAAFAAAVVITALCMKYRDREKEAGPLRRKRNDEAVFRIARVRVPVAAALAGSALASSSQRSIAVGCTYLTGGAGSTAYARINEHGYVRNGW